MSELSIRITDETFMGRMQELFDLIARGLKAGPVVVKLGRDKRTKAQNDKLWPMLRDVAGQVEWHGQKLGEDDWKHLFSAVTKGQRVIAGVDGRLVVLGYSTREMTKQELSDMVEAIYAFGAEHGVEWSE